MHTTASDGKLTPRQVVARAARLGLSGLGIADHDTVDGLDEAECAGAQMGIIIIPGVELSSASDGEEVHLLAYCPDRSCPEFERMLVWYRQTRRERLLRILERLTGLGMDTDLLAARIGGEERSWGRPHVAQELVRAGIASSVSDAFARYLSRGGLAYVAREWLDPQTILGWIHECGAVGVVAHPGRLPGGLIRRLISLGLDGIEVYHPDHGPGVQIELLGLAGEYGLLVTGGSDFHGPGMGKFGELGSFVVPVGVVDDLEARRDLIRSGRGAPEDSDCAGR